MKKILVITGIIFIVALIGGYFYVQQLKKSALPDYNEHLQIEGLTGKVSVYRDAQGVPHIVAENEKDLYTMAGYLSAQDRLWQMDLLRRVTQGRLSEIFGEELIDTDVILRKLRIPDNAVKLYPKLKDSVRNPLIYFANGVNQYIAMHQDDLPFEFRVLGYKPEAWKPQHSLNLVGFMAWNLEFGYKMEAFLEVLKEKTNRDKWAELFPDYSTMKTYVYPSYTYKKPVDIDTVLVAALDKIGQLTPDIFTGSNNWVVAGKKSTTGKPIFSNDMHLGLDIPGIWTRMHLMIPGKLNVTGVVLPGEPYVVAGHNERIAWGMTNVMLDGADFYVETINPDNKAQYKFNGQWRDMEVRKEKIYVKGKDKPVEKTLYFTHRGPIFSRFDELKFAPVSLRWIGNEETREIDALYNLSTAENWKDFCQAIRGFQSVSQNIAYADINGNIGIHMTGRLPKRTAPGFTFFPGDTDRYDWKGFVAFDSLPYEYNPERGYVSSANNKSVDESYPYYISEWYEVPYRIKRIRQLLTAKEKLSVSDFKDMLNDHYSVQAEEIMPVLLQHLQAEKDWDEPEKQALALLEKWNFKYETGNREPLIFEEFLMHLVKNLTADEMGEKMFKIYKDHMLLSKYLLYNAFQQNNSLWADDVNTAEKETFHQMIVKSFKESTAEIKDKYGEIATIKWGDTHKLNLKHPLGKVSAIDWAFDLNRTYDAPGNNNTVNPFAYINSEAYSSNFGASEKHIFNTADWNQSYSILPTGVSGNPASKYYCNQSEDYVKGKLYRDIFSLNEVKKSAKYTAVYSK